MSNRKNISNAVMQGSVWGSLKCVVQMNKLGKEAYSKPETLYMYKGKVHTPPLQMIDDIIAISTCSQNKGNMNKMINTFMDHKKLFLSKKKCCKVHIGKRKSECCELKVSDTIMKEETQSKYLGDILHTSGKIKFTINDRVAKGHGIISEIMSIIEEIPFGHRRVQVGLILRNAKFLNGILFNSECWHGITMADIVRFERLDNILLRGILGAHSKIPVE